MDCCNCLLYALLHDCTFSIDNHSPINKFYSFIIFSLLINAVILLLNCLVLILCLYVHFLSLRCYFLYLSIIWSFMVTGTALKVSTSLCFFTASISHGVENYFPRLWGTGISDAILYIYNFIQYSIFRYGIT